MPVPVAGKAGRKPSKFCHKSCRHKYHHRRASRGAIVYDLAMKMRKERAKGGFADLCHQLTLFLGQDKADGRKTYYSYDKEPIPWHTPDADPMKPRGK